jgi:uncharacterized protein with PQ loop repeat
MSSPQCSNPNLSVVMAITNCMTIMGIASSYVSQHARIIVLKTSEGISPWFLLLGGISSFCTFLNSLLKSLPLFECVRLHGTRYLTLLFGFYQLGVIFICFLLMIALSVFYFPPHLKHKASPDKGSTSSDIGTSTSNLSGPYLESGGERKVLTTEWTNYLIMLVTLTGSVLILSILALGLHSSSVTKRPFMIVVSLLAMALNVAQYGPQILQVWRTKRIGAFSIPMLCIQIPGCIVTAIVISVSPSGSDWTAWVPMLVTSAMQSILLVLCLMYRKNEAKVDSSAKSTSSPTGSPSKLKQRKPSVPALADNKSSDDLV